MSAAQYKLLNLTASTRPSEGDVNCAYKKLALKLHPDKNTGTKDTTSQFQQLNSAHKAVLTHVSSRPPPPAAKPSPPEAKYLLDLLARHNRFRDAAKKDIENFTAKVKAREKEQDNKRAERWRKWEEEQAAEVKKMEEVHRKTDEQRRQREEECKMRREEHTQREEVPASKIQSGDENTLPLSTKTTASSGIPDPKHYNEKTSTKRSHDTGTEVEARKKDSYTAKRFRFYD